MNIISNLREQITAIRGRSMPYPGRLDDMIKEHENIYEAIAQRSVDKAQKAVRTHMENAERTLLKVIEANEKAEEKQKKEGKA
jgi:DNA-binding GntR family transcriptional regulator